MDQVIDYFFTHISPWAYLGHEEIQRLAARSGMTIHPRPVRLPDVFGATGGLPLAKRHPARQAYRFIEMQRWREKRNLPLNLQPKYFPADTERADRCAIALHQLGGQAMAFSGAAFRAVWVDDRNIADEAVLRDLLSAAGAQADAVLALADDEKIAGAYAENQETAIELGVIGSPCYVLNGEPFWGQDRLDLLEDALTSKRERYVPLSEQ